MTIDAINNFDSSTLAALDEKNLLSNRRDVKYVFPVSILNDVLSGCVSDYSILEIEGKKIFNYQTTYYDTADLRMYHEHQRGKLERTKIRVRKYLDADQSFVELKIKNNKNKTIKNRIAGENLQMASALIGEKSNYLINELLKMVVVSYKRITLLHKTKNEKLTIDFDLMMNNDSGEASFAALCFAEVKTTVPQRTNFCRTMKRFGIREGSMSKYCLGVVSLYPEVKKNNFKLPLLQITKTRIHEAV